MREKVCVFLYKQREPLSTKRMFLHAKKLNPLANTTFSIRAYYRPLNFQTQSNLERPKLQIIMASFKTSLTIALYLLNLTPQTHTATPPSQTHIISRSQPILSAPQPNCREGKYGSNLNITSCTEAVALLQPPANDPIISWGKRGSPSRIKLPNRYLSCESSMLHRHKMVDEWC